MADGDRNVLPFPEATGTSTSVVYAEAAEVVRLELYRVTHQPPCGPTGQSNMMKPPPIPPIETTATIAMVPFPELLPPHFAFEPSGDTNYSLPLPAHGESLMTFIWYFD